MALRIERRGSLAPFFHRSITRAFTPSCKTR
jgi:hypothetical protein